MGKTSSSSSSRPANGSFTLSDGTSVRTKNGNTSYTMSPIQQKTYDYAQKSFFDGLEGINVFSPETLESMAKEVEAYKNKSQKLLDKLYQPIVQNTMEDAAKRFGNLDNSIYLQNLNKAADNRADALSNLAQDVTAKERSLVNDELQRRYNYLNLLNNYSNQVFNNAIGAAGISNNSAGTTSRTTQNSMNTSDMLQLVSAIAAFI